MRASKIETRAEFNRAVEHVQRIAEMGDAAIPALHKSAAYWLERIREYAQAHGIDLFIGGVLAENRPSDAVNSPEHYLQYDMEVIDIIRHVLGPEGFRAYCIGNELKYRLRAGDKGDPVQDFAKAEKYREFRRTK
jgi:hypothetical protein